MSLQQWTTKNLEEELLSKEQVFSEESSIGSSSPLLRDTNDTEAQRNGARTHRIFQVSATRWLYFHVSFWALYTILIFSCKDFIYQVSCNASVYSPATVAVTYQKTTFHGDLDVNNKYKGPPRPELDAAWEKLLEPMNIKVNSNALKRMNRTSIKLQGEDDTYFTSMNVYHHLHCLKKIRHYMHKDYYETKTDDLKESNHEEHIEHCLDDIRQALMCHADVALITYSWLPDSRKPWPNFEVQHECVNWDNLQNWALDHSFSLFDQKSLVHPTLGLSFPLVDGKIETVSKGEGVHIVWPDEHRSSSS